MINGKCTSVPRFVLGFSKSAKSLGRLVSSFGSIDNGLKYFLVFCFLWERDISPNINVLIMPLHNQFTGEKEINHC